jgi:thiamine-phosphate pyrophosphorylase
MRKLIDKSLYFVTGEEYSSPRGSVQVVASAIEGGVDIVQMREKAKPRSELVSLGKNLAGICRAAGVTFIVNDDPFLAAEIGADGVHLGQEDMVKYPVDEARSVLGKDAVIGVSTHSLSEFNEAGAKDVDYIAFGPVFPTGTKDYYIGVDDVPAALEASKKPVVLIGGIDFSNVDSLIALGARNIAVIRAIAGAADVKEAAGELSGKIKGLDRTGETLVIKVNGKDHVIRTGTDLPAFLNASGLDKSRIVIEYNRRIVPTERWHEVSFASGDVLEIVSFVGGG